MLKKLLSNKVLLIIFLVALILRVVGDNYGYPFIFHPDEPTVVRSALGIRFYPNPKHFDWPHLYIYLNFMVYLVFTRARMLIELMGFKSQLAMLWDGDFVFYFITRVFSGVLGASSIFFIYKTAERLFSKRSVSLLAAATFAVIPFHVQHSHYSLIDVPMLFFATLGLYFAVGILTGSRWKDYIYAGIFIGLATSTKYNAGLLVIAVAVAHLIRVLRTKETLVSLDGLKKLTVSALVCILAFVAGTPFALIDYDTFLRTDGPQGALWQFTNVGKTTLATHFQQFGQILSVQQPSDMGYTPFIVFILGFALFLINFKKATNKEMLSKFIYLYLISFFLLWYLSGLSKTRSHYFMVTYPFIVITTSYTFVALVEKLKNKYLRIALTILYLALPFILSAQMAIVYARPDTRNELYTFLKANEVGNRFIYDGEALKLVMTKFKANSVKTQAVRFSSMPTQKGYMIISKEPQDPSHVYFYVDNPVELSETVYKEPSQVIYPKWQKGPIIYIYKLN